MKRVLVISYYFPPDGGAGTQRAAKFCKYLPEFGWKPIVVTRTEPERRGTWDPLDASLVDDIGAETEVVRVAPPAAAVGRQGRFARRNAERGWLEGFAAAAERVIAGHDVAAVLITMSPFELTQVGERLRRPNLPVIYDLRDPWALDGWRTYRSILDWRLDLGRMKRAFRSADGIVANTPDSLKAFLAMLPSLDPRRLETIPNGFDAEDFERVAEAVVPEAPDRFRLVHTGTPLSICLYRDPGLRGLIRHALEYRAEPMVPSGRTFLHLLAAIRLLRDRRHPRAESLQLVHAGVADSATKRCVRESGVEDAVALLGYRPHVETVTWLRRADALFLALHDLPAGHRSLIVPGKTYEYLASGKPILGCLPPGDAADLVAASGRGFLAPPCDPERIASRLAEMLDLWASGAVKGGLQLDGVAQFERRELTRRLAGFLSRLTTRQNADPRATVPAGGAARSDRDA